MFGSHHILVARTKDFEDLGYRLCSIGHCTDGLYTASLKYLADASHTGGIEDGRIHLTLLVGRCTEHNLLTASNLGRCGEHQDGREEWGSTTRDIESDLLDGDTLLPASHPFLCLDFLSYETLGDMEHLNVMMSQDDGVFQFVTD